MCQVFYMEIPGVVSWLPVQLHGDMQFGTLQPENGSVFLQRTNHCSVISYWHSAQTDAHNVHLYAHVPAVPLNS
jgi:hypothetical protein